MALELTVLRDQPAEPGNPAADEYSVNGGFTSPITIPSGSFIAGHRYWTIFSAHVGMDVNFGQARGQMISTPDASFGQPFFIDTSGAALNPSGKQWFGTDVFTATGVDAATMQFQNLISGSNFWITYPSLIAIDMDTSADFENNGEGAAGDWWYKKTGDAVVIPNTWTNKGSLNFIADGVSDYLLVAVGSAETLAFFSGTRTARMRVLLDTSTLLTQHFETLNSGFVSSSSWPLTSIALLSASGVDGGHGQVVPPLTSGSHTIDIEFQGDSVFTAPEVVFVLIRLSRFAASAVTYVDQGILGPGLDCMVTSGVHPMGLTDGCNLIPGLVTPDVVDAGGSAGLPLDRVSLFRYELNSTGERHDFALFDDDASLSTITSRPKNVAFPGGRVTGDRPAVTGVFVDNDVVPASQNLTPMMRIQPDGTSIGVLRQSIYASFFTALAPGIVEATLSPVVAANILKTADLDTAVADEILKTASLSAAVAEARSKIASLNTTVAQALTLIQDMDAVVGDGLQIVLPMNAHLSGSQFIEVLLRVQIAATQTLALALEALVAVSAQLTANLDLAITDEAQIVIEQDRPKLLPFIEVDDLETS